MVLMVDPEGWEQFKSYAEICRIGTYQIKETVEGKDVKIQAGRFGIVMSFDDLTEKAQKELYDEMLEFCALNSFIQIQGSISDELLFA